MTQPESLATLPLSINQGLKNEGKSSMRSRLLCPDVLGVLCSCVLAFQIAWAQSAQPKNHDEYLRMTSELQAEKQKVLEQMRANNVALFDIQGLGDLLKAPLPVPEPVDLANRVKDLKSAEQAYRNGDNETAMSKFYDVLSWFVLKSVKEGGEELGPVHDTAKAATQFEIEWQTKIGKHDALILQLARIAQRQAELDRSAAAATKTKFKTSEPIIQHKSAPYPSLTPASKPHVPTSEPKPTLGLDPVSTSNKVPTASPSQAKPIAGYSCAGCVPTSGTPIPPTRPEPPGSDGPIQTIDEALRQPRQITLNPLPETPSGPTQNGTQPGQSNKAPSVSIGITGQNSINASTNWCSSDYALCEAWRNGGDREAFNGSDASTAREKFYGENPQLTSFQKVAAWRSPASEVDESIHQGLLGGDAGPQQQSGPLPERSSPSVTSTDGNAIPSTPANATGPRGGVNARKEQGYQVDDGLANVIDQGLKAAKPEDQEVVKPQDGKVTKPETKKP